MSIYTSLYSYSLILCLDEDDALSFLAPPPLEEEPSDAPSPNASRDSLEFGYYDLWESRVCLPNYRPYEPLCRRLHALPKRWKMGVL